MSSPQSSDDEYFLQDALYSISLNIPPPNSLKNTSSSAANIHITVPHLPLEKCSSQPFTPSKTMKTPTKSSTLPKINNNGHVFLQCSTSPHSLSPSQFGHLPPPSPLPLSTTRKLSSSRNYPSQSSNLSISSNRFSLYSPRWIKRSSHHQVSPAFPCSKRHLPLPQYSSINPELGITNEALLIATSSITSSEPCSFTGPVPPPGTPLHSSRPSTGFLRSLSRHSSTPRSDSRGSRARVFSARNVVQEDLNGLKSSMNRSIVRIRQNFQSDPNYRQNFISFDGISTLFDLFLKTSESNIQALASFLSLIHFIIQLTEDGEVFVGSIEFSVAKSLFQVLKVCRHAIHCQKPQNFALISSLISSISQIIGCFPCIFITLEESSLLLCFSDLFNLIHSGITQPMKSLKKVYFLINLFGLLCEFLSFLISLHVVLIQSFFHNSKTFEILWNLFNSILKSDVEFNCNSIAIIGVCKIVSTILLNTSNGVVYLQSVNCFSVLNSILHDNNHVPALITTLGLIIKKMNVKSVKQVKQYLLGSKSILSKSNDSEICFILLKNIRKVIQLNWFQPSNSLLLDLIYINLEKLKQFNSSFDFISEVCKFSLFVLDFLSSFLI
ncbi:hypothetical protein P9112_007799 [Eukaryota sp. TZLM1-RC]